MMNFIAALLFPILVLAQYDRMQTPGDGMSEMMGNGSYQNGMGGYDNTGSMNGAAYGPGNRRKLDLSFLKGQGQCAFEPQISADDKTLLANAERAINALRENDKCKAVKSQFDHFGSAMASYNSQTGADRAPGYDGMININCVNYNQIYDLEYDFFVNNWDSRGDSLSDPYYLCRSLDQEEALICGAKIIGQKKAVKKQQCDISSASINSQKNSQLVGESFRTGLEALKAIMNNDECLDASGEQKLSIMQSAVNLAGRAATIGSAGGPMGLLIGGATDLIGSVFSKLFSSSNKSKDNLAILTNRNNFTKLACLYEKLEEKALRCERVGASREVERMRKEISDAQNCVEVSGQNIGFNRFLKNMSDVAAGLVSKDEQDNSNNRSMDQQTFDSIIQNLESSFPGTNEKTIDIAQKMASETILKLDAIMASDSELREYARNGGIQDPSGADLRRIKGQLENEKKMALGIQQVMNAIKETNDKGTQIDSEDLLKVTESMKSIAGGPMNFMGMFNSVMMNRVKLFPDDDLSSKIKAYNMKLSEGSMYEQVLSRINSQEKIANSEFQDNGVFAETQAALRPHLKKMLNQELDVLLTRATNLKDIKPGKPDAALKEHMQTKEEEIIYPILRACNQLRSVMKETKTGDEHSACKAMNCSHASKTFSDYLTETRVTQEDASSCKSSSCQAHYNRYICQERTRLPGIRSNLKNEFLTKGTLCGKSMAQAFAP